MSDDESPTSANLGDDHKFIIKEYFLDWCESFWGSRANVGLYPNNPRYKFVSVNNTVNKLKIFLIGKN